MANLTNLKRKQIELEAEAAAAVAAANAAAAVAAAAAAAAATPSTASTAATLNAGDEVMEETQLDEAAIDAKMKALYQQANGDGGEDSETRDVENIRREFNTKSTIVWIPPANSVDLKKLNADVENVKQNLAIPEIENMFFEKDFINDFCELIYQAYDFKSYPPSIQTMLDAWIHIFRMNMKNVTKERFKMRAEKTINAYKKFLNLMDFSSGKINAVDLDPDLLSRAKQGTFLLSKRRKLNTDEPIVLDNVSQPKKSDPKKEKEAAAKKTTKTEEVTDPFKKLNIDGIMDYMCYFGNHVNGIFVDIRNVKDITVRHNVSYKKGNESCIGVSLTFDMPVLTRAWYQENIKSASKEGFMVTDPDFTDIFRASLSITVPSCAEQMNVYRPAICKYRGGWYTYDAFSSGDVLSDYNTKNLQTYPGSVLVIIKNLNLTYDPSRNSIATRAYGMDLKYQMDKATGRLAGINVYDPRCNKRFIKELNNTQYVEDD